jgi:hypothetical protein
MESNSEVISLKFGAVDVKLGAVDIKLDLVLSEAKLIKEVVEMRLEAQRVELHVSMIGRSKVGGLRCTYEYYISILSFPPHHQQ